MKTLLVAVVLLFAGSASADASGPTDLAGIWHRLNPSQSQANPVPEHEQLECHRTMNGSSWACRYFKIPEPRLGFGWDTTRGTFAGRDVTATWNCPEWFPQTICNNVVQVVEGTFTFDPASGTPFSSFQDLVVIRANGEKQLYDYWVGAFACPWFESFDEALGANPSRTGDCLVAP